MQDEFSPIPSSQGTVLKYKGKFMLQNGSYLIDPYLTYNSYGELNAQKSNTIIVCQPLTANTQLHTWWGKILGEDNGYALDTKKYFILCIGMICSPYGQVGPLSINPQTNKQYLKSFPATTVRDSAKLQIQLIKQKLNIDRFVSIIGGSLGGFYALQWELMAKYYGIKVESLFLIASSASYSAWQMSFTRIMLEAIYNDPKWENYDVNDPPNKGLALARQIGMISYRSKYAYDSKFGRKIQENTDDMFQVDSYLKYQGEKFVKRFDPLSYVFLLKQMNTHDIGRGRGGIQKALALIDIPITIATVQGDVLCGLKDQIQLKDGLKRVQHVFVKSNDGHDGYLLAWEEVGAAMKRHLQNYDKIV